jgi:hypothetical protein
MKPPSVCQAASFSHRLSVSPPGALLAENNCPTTFDSRCDRDCSPDHYRMPQSTRRPRPLLPGLPSPACMLPTHRASLYKTVLLCPQKSSPFRVAPITLLDNGAPSLHAHYKPFNATTGTPAPVLRIGTLTLAEAVCLSFSLNIGATGSYVPH